MDILEAIYLIPRKLTKQDEIIIFRNGKNEQNSLLTR
jgi:hypothetical protein